MVDDRWAGINMQQWCKHTKKSSRNRYYLSATLSAIHITRTGLHSRCSFMSPNFMKQGPSWEANRLSACQEIPRILWNPKIHYSIHKARYPSLFWARSIQSMRPTHFLKIHFGIVLSFRPGSSKCSLSLRFLHQNTVCSSSLSHTCYVPCPSHSF